MATRPYRVMEFWCPGEVGDGGSCSIDRGCFGSEESAVDRARERITRKNGPGRCLILRGCGEVAWVVADGSVVRREGLTPAQRLWGSVS